MGKAGPLHRLSSRDRRPLSRVRSGDAYACGSEDGATWTIGTDAVEAVFECRRGNFRLAGCRNKLTEPLIEYVSGTDGFALVPGGCGWALAAAGGRDAKKRGTRKETRR